jgi:ankyrin repeat protein
MSLLSLSNELLLLIAENLDEETINAFARTSRRSHRLVNPLLYQVDTQMEPCAWALEWAARNGRLSTAQLSLSAGAGQSQESITLCMEIASHHGFLDLVILLAENRAKDITSPYSLPTYLCHAIANTQEHVVQWALENDSQFQNIKDPISANLMLGDAIAFGSCSVVEHLLNNGAEIENRDFDNHTPILIAITILCYRCHHFSRKNPMSQVMVDYSLRSRYPPASLNIIAPARNSELVAVIKILLAHNANPHAKIDGETGIEIAKLHDDQEVRDLFIACSNETAESSPSA